MQESDLAGVWQLRSFRDIDSEGVEHDGPLGPDPRGLLFYSPDGHVSLNMMRTGTTEAGTARDDPQSRMYLSYAGTWRLEGNRVLHSITVAPHPRWVGTEQSRELTLDGNRLTLCGVSLSGPKRLRRVQWQRVG